MCAFRLKVDCLLFTSFLGNVSDTVGCCLFCPFSDALIHPNLTFSYQFPHVKRKGEKREREVKMSQSLLACALDFFKRVQRPLQLLAISSNTRGVMEEFL